MLLARGRTFLASERPRLLEWNTRVAIDFIVHQSKSESKKDSLSDFYLTTNGGGLEDRQTYVGWGDFLGLKVARWVHLNRAPVLHG